jgi:hypothetical protein
MDGTTNQTYRIYGGYVNTGARNLNGTLRGIGDSLIGQRYSDQFFGLTNLASYATNARLPNCAVRPVSPPPCSTPRSSTSTSS